MRLDSLSNDSGRPVSVAGHVISPTQVGEGHLPSSCCDLLERRNQRKDGDLRGNDARWSLGDENFRQRKTQSFQRKNREVIPVSFFRDKIAEKLRKLSLFIAGGAKTKTSTEVAMVFTAII